MLLITRWSSNGSDWDLPRSGTRLCSRPCVLPLCRLPFRDHHDHNCFCASVLDSFTSYIIYIIMIIFVFLREEWSSSALSTGTSTSGRRRGSRQSTLSRLTGDQHIIDHINQEACLIIYLFLLLYSLFWGLLFVWFRKFLQYANAKIRVTNNIPPGLSTWPCAPTWLQRTCTWSNLEFAFNKHVMMKYTKSCPNLV